MLEKDVNKSLQCCISLSKYDMYATPISRSILQIVVTVNLVMFSKQKKQHSKQSFFVALVVQFYWFDGLFCGHFFVKKSQKTNQILKVNKKAKLWTIQVEQSKVQSQNIKILFQKNLYQVNCLLITKILKIPE